MSEKEKAILEFLEERFTSLHDRALQAVAKVPAEELFLDVLPGKSGIVRLTFGECILRSAAAVEQAFGGLTVRLWDDPFEWTLPEELSTPEKISAYLKEVSETRRRGFSFLAADDVLLKRVPAPEQMKTIFEVLLDALARAEHFLGRADAARLLLPSVQAATT